MKIILKTALMLGLIFSSCQSFGQYIKSKKKKTKGYCKPTKVKNFTQTWTESDILNLKIAYSKCDLRHKGNGCLVEFRKIGDLRYLAICGAAVHKVKA